MGRLECQIQFFHNCLELADHNLLLLLSLATVQYPVLVLLQQNVDLLELLSDRRFADHVLLHLALVDLQQLLVSAVQLADELVHAAQLFVEFGHLGLCGEVGLLFSFPLVDALVELDVELLQSDDLFVDDLVLVLDILLLVSDDLVEFLDDPVGALYLANGLHLLELKLLLDHLVLILQLEYPHLHAALLSLVLLLPSHPLVCEIIVLLLHEFL